MKISDPDRETRRPRAAFFVALVTLIIGAPSPSIAAEPLNALAPTQVLTPHDVAALEGLLKTHAQRYPRMQPQDLYKLVHQRVMGPAHAVIDPAHATAWMNREVEALGAPRRDEVAVEPLDGELGLVRVHLRPWLAEKRDPALLVDAFVKTASRVKRDPGRLAASLAWTATQVPSLGLGFDRAAFEVLVDAQRAGGFSAVHHSEVYRESYAPAYRVVLGAFFDGPPAAEAWPQTPPEP